MNNLNANVNELVGVVVRLPPFRPEGNWAMAIARRAAVKPTEEVR